MSMFKPYKVVYKPWGKEVWLDLNDHYCYKRIYINKGYRTSFQYHEYKQETNFIIEGKAEVWLEDEETGEVKTYSMEAGDFFPVKPPLKHRVIALTDIILQEVSTPHVDDVIRIQDDANRQDGKIDSEHETPAVCVLASGAGTRLQEFGSGFNKGLLKINNKAVISHIIEKFPEDYEVYITLGHYAESLVEYCSAAHSDRNISFVSVENYDDSCSGPGTSLLACERYLKKPFYVTTVDCLIDDEMPPLTENWLGVYKTGIPEIYSTVDIDVDGNIHNLVNKSDHGFQHAFVGLAAIYEYETFWRELKSNIGESGELVSAWFNPNVYNKLISKEVSWHDVGTVENYQATKEHFEKLSDKLSIDKTMTERFYIINDKFIKINNDKKAVKSRIERSKKLQPFVPLLIFKGDYTFAYDLIDGSTLYDLDNVDVYENFLNWCFENLQWSPNVTDDISSECYEFYHNKTMKRLELLEEINKDLSGEFVINGKSCISCRELLNKLDWENLCRGSKTKFFHGDLQFDNVLLSKQNEFHLLDWRSDFAGVTSYGDCYYDLAKMYGGLELSYKIMRDFEKNITYEKIDKTVLFDYARNENLLKFKNVFREKVVAAGFDMDKIEILTSLVYLNMSPLHKSPMQEMLFFKSMRMMEGLIHD